MTQTNDTDRALIESALETLLPGGEAATVDPELMRTALTELVAGLRADIEENFLGSLLTIPDLAEILGVTRGRATVLARHRHELFGIGWQLPHSETWLFRPADLELLAVDGRTLRKGLTRTSSMRRPDGE